MERHRELSRHGSCRTNIAVFSHGSVDECVLRVVLPCQVLNGASEKRHEAIVAVNEMVK